MLKTKIIGSVLTAALITTLAAQIGFAKSSKDDDSDRRVTSPLTSPITGPCRPGWGFGDKNHCHSGPPGLQHHKDNRENRDND